ncbi:MAG: hypothetical protein EHM17_02075 [Verrucomicrobiaceae bacterium]|nr:MAG: hypothetical protein EHM17_02075 [Verrucomicrobiaceae bacterium]
MPMITRILMISAMAGCLSTAAARPGKATVEWLASSATVEPGKPMQTAIRMVIDDGWHTYWINPGEAGMPTTVEWKLPPGWQTGGLVFPEPARFLTSGLAGFGYEGTVLFPVTLTPPADFTGKARLTAVVSWLACGESGCVPGEAEIHLDLAAGAASPTAEVAAISAAYQKLPRPAGNALRLTVAESGKNLLLSITMEPMEPGAAPDPGGREAFPATPEVAEPRAVIRFSKTGNTWTSEVPKSGYAAGPARRLTLVLAGGEAHGPLELTWSAP